MVYCIANAIPGLIILFLVRFIGGKYFGLPSMFPMLGASHPKSYILPIISLTLGSVAGRMMWMRRYMIDQSTMDYENLLVLKDYLKMKFSINISLEMPLVQLLMDFQPRLFCVFQER